MLHIKSAYQELKDRIELTSMTDTKTNHIRRLVDEQNDEFKIQDILNLAPELDREIVKKTLASLKSENVIRKIGSGRGSKWKKC